MKKRFQLPYLKTLLTTLIILAAFYSSAQEYTLKTTSANIVSSKSLIDVPGLTGNAQAIIVATPFGNTQTLNTNPIGAWYYSGKWNLFNSNHAVLIPGLTYIIQYFLNPGPQQFLHLVSMQNLGTDGSYIDNPGLNNQPNAQFSIFQNHSPDIRTGSALNPFEAKTGYSATAGKWFISNVGGQALMKGTAYNIVIKGSGIAGTITNNPINNSFIQACKCPASLPPDGQATGDLTGTYPAPMVQKLLGRSLSYTVPAIGQVLKWNGTEWAPSDDNVGNVATVTAAKPSFLLYTQNATTRLEQPISGSGKSVIPGLDNQQFTLAQSSRLVFHSVIIAQNVNIDPFATACKAEVVVEILNSSHAVVGRATCSLVLGVLNWENMNSVGITALPPGVYRTRVNIGLRGGGKVETYTASGHGGQGGQLIIEIFPD